MFANEVFVTTDSVQFFHTPGETAKALFFYPSIIGRYTYLPGYAKRRTSFGNFLIILVESGYLEVKTDGAAQRAGVGYVAFIDCYAPHEYSAPEGASILWMHFDGAMTREYYKVFYSRHKNVTLPRNPLQLQSDLRDILEIFEKGLDPDEIVLSLKIGNTLTSLMRSSRREENSTSAAIRKSISYISEHFAQDLTLDTLSRIAGLSTFHYSRLFKKETGMSPHQYLIETRLSSAKFYLASTDRTVSDIALSVGFGDESSFCLTFRKRVGITPKAWRQRALNADL